jgi:hypothetical protein
VQSFDFSGSGFDRGHMTPNADRDKETSTPINQATFLMSNMVAQAPGNNQGPWAAMEAYLRTLVDAGNELYIVSGPYGVGGTGSNGGTTNTLADGHVTVPSATWKVALVLTKDSGNDVSRVNCSTRTIAVIMPNIDSIRPNAWETYLTTVDAVEALTGYDFFSNLPEPYQRCIEAGTNGNNPALVKGDQTISFAQPADRAYGDAPVTMFATGGASGNAVTFSASGACTSTGPYGATITLDSVGLCTITASQAGTDIYNAAGDVVRTFSIVDTTPPVVTYSGNLGVYRIIDTIAITCSASDFGTNVTSTTCANITGPAYNFTLGLNTFSATATDAAGNVGTGSTTFTVGVSFADLEALVTLFSTNAGVANGLNAKLEAAAHAPNANAKSGQVGAFQNQVNAQTGKALTAAQAAVLLRLVQALY